MNDVTGILSAIDEGDPKASEELLILVYDELRRIAAAQLARERPGQTLQATALVHEAFVRLVTGDPTGAWSGRRHFFAAAAEAMRRILVENARRKHRLRHGGGRLRVDLEEAELEAVDLAFEGPREDVLALDEALSHFAAIEPRKAELVKLRFFAGMEEQEAADVLGISRATAARDWAFARAWLFDRLRDRPESLGTR
ncbi:MAG TPA: sigma-70 family RNA polymerase sigma factor [Pirellulales bacterium]|nr:sigma-70 family RNA polymerase sigma factor [Pirellulales bacterium]